MVRSVRQSSIQARHNFENDPVERKRERRLQDRQRDAERRNNRRAADFIKGRI